ncbi:Prolyl endopeptidase [Alphaproteobacteria bacterium SO-S41]|nr:Prolyl endopeptidase [Alphaproteobacteria bacterium SO-S41]
MPAIDRRTLLVSAAATAVAGLLPRTAFADLTPPPPATPALPVARITPVTEDFFGASVTDNYRWMEDAKDADWEPFMKGQNDVTRHVLETIPGNAELQKRVSELAGDLEIVNGVQVAGPYVFINKRPVGADNFMLTVREGIDGAERVLIDPTAMTEGDVHYSMDYWLASPDGKYVAYGLSTQGSEDSVLHVLETANGKVGPEKIDRAQYPAISWLPDSTSFFFNRLAEGAAKKSTDYYKNSVCWLHQVGADPATDKKVFSRGQFPEVEADEIDFPNVFAQTGSDIAIGGLFAGVQNEITLYVNTLAKAVSGEGGWQKICVAADQVTGFTVSGADIYLVTYKDAPRYRALHVTLAAPAVAGGTEVIPQSEAVLQGLYTAKDGVYAQYLDGGVGRLKKLNGGTLSDIALPFDGAIGGLYADSGRDGAFINLQSWVVPATIYEIKADGALTETRLVAKPNIDVSLFTSERLFATAKDGTKVPVSIVYKKDRAKDGTAPVYLQAYGSYGINSEPYFGTRYIAWMERGGIWATANVRGGGEYGREWHEQGRLLNKPNTWGDMIASAEAIIGAGWSAPGKMAINGGSAGGITVGRSLTDRPDLFSAVISQVGVSNNLRAEFGQNGPPNIPEFGSVTTEEGFKGLYAMDSTQHVKAGTAYPGVLLTTGMTDPRVDPWHAAKMTAHLQAATSSGKPVLLRVEYDGGHGLGSTRAQRDREWADLFAFALWQAGEPGFQPG